MKTMKSGWLCSAMSKALLCGALLLSCAIARIDAQVLPFNSTFLNEWSFETDEWLSDYSDEPVSFSNIECVATNGSGNSLLIAGTNAAWLQYNVVESYGSTNLAVDQGTVILWFMPLWSSVDAGGDGPGEWGRLIEVGAHTEDASYGHWSLYFDPQGTNIYFSAQTNGASITYLSYPISWTNGVWHALALTYSATNSTLYVDGAAVTNGLPMTIWPGQDVLTNGFFVGSDSNGFNKAQGFIDGLSTYSRVERSTALMGLAGLYSIVYNNPMAFTSATNDPYVEPTYSAITGAGYLQYLGSLSSCFSTNDVWLTNMSCTVISSNLANFSFGITGGWENYPYDVFATAVLTPGSTNYQWAWMGQGYHCENYQVPNLPIQSAFFRLGTPQDSDGDGLTDAFELLVSKTNPFNPDSDGDGISDAEEVLSHTDPLISNPAVPASLNIQTCPQ